MYLLDTNVVSELRKIKSNKVDKAVVEWFSKVSSEMLFISVITLLEIEMGILSKQRKDPDQGAVLKLWFNNQVIPAFANRVLDIDTDVALQCARLHVPDPRSDRDALIAATALVHNLTIVTRNIGDFQPTGVAIINPWGE
ncbi:type II toxin-antitoxin system VapC family toxin [Piscirickettsia salmonis]|uniref:type II toxin-antitoxin system VapC family toxin n=1 Tax=Piscirickettsia salmonis TaxID=1238 RepID=UPI0007C934CC|nr:PIN domain protein [Piscirickettsiaceae bacterium NZ-RLO1]